MEERFAKIISVVFHPLLIPTYAFALLINIDTHYTFDLPENYRYITILLVFLTSFAMPALFMLILLKIGVIKSLQMETRQERTFPLLIVSIFFYGTFYLLKQGPQFWFYNVFLLGSISLVIICLFINYFTKISIHMVAIGGFFGALVGYSLVLGVDLRLLLSVVILISGFVGFARLELKAHSGSQVYGGFALGTIFMLCMLLVMTY